jgi:hypothetical protein
VYPDRVRRFAPLLALLVATLMAVAPARAQKRPDDPLAPLRLDPGTLDRAYRRAQARRNIGIGLSAPGVALAILGAVLVGYGANDHNLFGGGAEIASGSVAAGVGIAIGIPGVVLWIMGQDDMDVVNWRKQQLADPQR